MRRSWLWTAAFVRGPFPWLYWVRVTLIGNGQGWGCHQEAVVAVVAAVRRLAMAAAGSAAP